MKSILRRVALGLGALLVVAGIGSFLYGHEAVRVLLAYPEAADSLKDQAKRAFEGGILLAAVGAGLLGLALPRLREKA